MFFNCEIKYTERKRLKHEVLCNEELKSELSCIVHQVKK